MARIRSIHPDACDSEKLGALTADAERLWWRLQTHCDDEGRCEDNPRLINARCMPMVDGWSAKKVDAALGELHQASLILRYRVRGDGFIQIEQWHRFQHPQRKTPSSYPDPEMADPPNDPGPDGTLTEDSRTPHGGLAEDSASARVHSFSGVGEEREGRGRGVGASLALVPIDTTSTLTPPAETVSFEAFWSEYPRKVGRAEAAKAWARATRSSDGAVILAGLRAHLPDLLTKEARYQPHGATWLNQRRWEDPVERQRPLGKNQSVLERLANGELR